MKPHRDQKHTLVDLLDRVLDRGVILHADLIISVSGIPLVGVSLKAAVAGIETMLQYGYFKEWDQEIREGSLSQESLTRLESKKTDD